MSRPLIGGSAVAAVLLSASLLFLAQTSLAEPLGEVPQEVRQKGAATETKIAGAETSPTTDAPEAGDADTKENADAATPNTSKAAIEKPEPEAESEASSPAVTFTA